LHHDWRAAILSFLALHNESLNVWSHTAGFVTFVNVAAVTAVHGSRALSELLHGSAGGGGGGGSGDPAAVVGADAAIVLYCLCAAGCMGVSATYHLLHVVDARINTLLQRLDYAFIAVLIWGSMIPMIYLGFHCNAAAMLAHGALVTATNGAAVAASTLPVFHTAAWRPARAAIFSAAGLVGLVPLLHLVLSGRVAALADLLLVGALYLGGALLYGLRIPERWAPGAFDLFGASHQLFHIAVFAAAAVHLRSLLTALAQRQAEGACPSYM
jgi:adiponectin receptor